jgi:hypothetical protein
MAKPLSMMRHIDDLAGKFAPVRQHVAAEQVHLDALKAPPLGGGRKNRFMLRKRHSMPPDNQPTGAG